MTTALMIDETAVPHLVPVREDGILSHVTRDCEEHRSVCHCVGNADEQGSLVFWCSVGEHLMTFR